MDDSAGRGASLYGELHPDGAQRLFRWLAPSADDTILDLGSGTGRLCLQAVATTAVGSAHGIELAATRAAIAARARDAWLQHSPSDSTRLHLVHDDLTTAPWPDATIVWIGATCFPSSLVATIARRLPELARVRRVVSTRPLPCPSTLRELGEMPLDATWAEGVRCKVYGPA